MKPTVINFKYNKREYRIITMIQTEPYKWEERDSPIILLDIPNFHVEKKITNNLGEVIWSPIRVDPHGPFADEPPTGLIEGIVGTAIARLAEGAVLEGGDHDLGDPWKLHKEARSARLRDD